MQLWPNFRTRLLVYLARSSITHNNRRLSIGVIPLIVKIGIIYKLKVMFRPAISWVSREIGVAEPWYIQNSLLLARWSCYYYWNNVLYAILSEICKTFDLFHYIWLYDTAINLLKTMELIENYFSRIY